MVYTLSLRVLRFPRSAVHLPLVAVVDRDSSQLIQQHSHPCSVRGVGDIFGHPRFIVVLPGRVAVGTVANDLSSHRMVEGGKWVTRPQVARALQFPGAEDVQKVL